MSSQEYNRDYYQRNKHRWQRPEVLARQRAWNKANPDRVRAAVRKKRAERLAIVHEFKSQPCVDCGIQYPPEVMDADHVRGEKVAHISVLAAKASVARLRAELEKCEVRCANCHRLRHLREKESNK